MSKIKSYFNYIAGNITTILKFLSSDQYIFVDGYPHTKNFGDALGTPIVEFLSHKKVLPSKNISRFLFHLLKFRNYAVVGSILQWVKNQSIVWGAGFISDQNIERISVPSTVFAVRGPKSREVYLKNNIPCPEVYGDPALLLPLMYYPEVSKKFKFGIIPHYFDYNHPWINEVRQRKDVLIIDLMVYTDYQLIVNQILSCESILSTSLHGLIVSDAYRIPNLHITLSDKVVGAGFKFEDYYRSVGKTMQGIINPVHLKLEDLDFSSQMIRIDLKKLIKACPFIVPEKLVILIDLLEQNTEFAHLNAE